jgi:hypothetical protein
VSVTGLGGKSGKTTGLPPLIVTYCISKECKESIMEIAKVTAKGQITIPQDIRQRMGIKKGIK